MNILRASLRLGCRSFVSAPSALHHRTPTVAKALHQARLLASPLQANELLICRAFAAQAVSRPIPDRDNISPLKKRVSKKKASAIEKPNVLAYATCEEYDLEGIVQALSEQALYVRRGLPAESDAIHVQAKYVVDGEQRDVFFFREGCVVFWNFTDTEANSVLQLLKAFEDSPFSQAVVEDEREQMEFELFNGPKTRVSEGKIELSKRRLSAEQDEQAESCVSTNKDQSAEPLASGQDGGAVPRADPLEMYAFSNAVSLSVKLGIWEATLDEYVESIESMLEDIRHGRKLSLSREHVFRKTGELFALRHRLNLSSDLLDTPDFYWDRERLETLFVKTTKLYAIDRRTRVMNEKIQHCQELMELVSHHLEDNHHVRLELMIIILIVVEVMFEILHYVERFSHSESSATE